MAAVASMNHSKHKPSPSPSNGHSSNGYHESKENGNSQNNINNDIVNKYMRICDIIYT